ncbi:MAG TPA: chemotaxis response regulator protein-glutamate methylesterase [Gudongella oleilytica]|jgi:two-component system chemotaxis response regulator CheB|nr:chemotaxis response regulator protein-glutamate methylesterase [Gudongella oleilytica]
MAIRVLIVDDSAFMRKIISDMMNEFRDIEVVGTARNGIDALEIIPNLKPDIITLDVEMPGLNGIETLKEIKRRTNIPVIMLSSNSRPEITIEALEHGAIDFIEKPVNIGSNFSEIKSDIEHKIKNYFNENLLDSRVLQKNPVSKSTQVNRRYEALVIGASTGGPKALVQLVSRLPKNTRIPVFIVQHMPKGFTTSLAERMDRESQIKVVEAQNGMNIDSGTVYLAPGDYHMVIVKDQIMLQSTEKIHGVRPAVDYLFFSAAEKYKEKLLAVILTGMGKDGSDGMSRIKEAGGYNIAQDKESSIVFGMPGSVISRGVVDEILSLEDISKTLNRMVR